MTDKLMVELESIVDRSSLKAVIEALSEIAWAKAEHIRSNWQDETLAICWDHAGNALDKFAAKVSDV